MRKLFPILIVLAAGIAWYFWAKPKGPIQDNMLRQASLVEIREHMTASPAKFYLVNLWASWCEPCKVEFPGLLDLRKKYETKGLKLILISMDHLDQEKEARDFLNTQKVDFLTFFKGTQETNFLSGQFPNWQGAIPASFLLDKDLKVVETWLGLTKESDFEAKIGPRLEGR